MTKRGKELKLDLSQNYNIVTGTVDSKNPKSFYVNITAWSEPLIDDDNLDYTRVISNLTKKVKQELFNYLTQEHPDLFVPLRNIVDLDMRESGIRYGKRSFLNCELTIFQSGELPIDEEPMVDIIQDIINHLVVEAFDTNVYFEFHKKKK
jgi:hypothetical protein